MVFQIRQGPDVTVEEIKLDVKQLGALKASGPDGLQGIFFIKYWNEVSTNVIGLVREIFDTCFIYPKLNRTFIALIHKKPTPISVRDYRPITLCNFAMKIIIKILANRFRPILGDLVSAN